MSVRRWASRCPGPAGADDCEGRWHHEEEVSKLIRELPSRAVSESHVWLVECEHGHRFRVDAVKERQGDYRIVIP